MNGFGFHSLRAKFPLSLIGWVLCFLFLLLLSRPAAAQIPIPDEVPDDADPRSGVLIYRQRCANCHGPLGMGDGELAANLPQPPLPIGSAEYLATADPDAIFAQIQSGNIAAGMPGFGVGNNSDPLSSAEIWDVVAGIYQLPILNQPVAEAVVNGRVINGTTGESQTGLGVTLQGFDSQFNETLRLESPLAEDGTFRFDLRLVSPDWFYWVFVEYNGLEFSSRLVSIDPLQPEIELPLTVYETTTQDDNIRVSQLAFLLDFGPQTLQVAELYTFNHNEDQVYIGPTGDLEDGSLALTLPAGAEQVSLLRGFGGPADFAPLPENNLVRDGTTLRPKLPVDPGRGVLRLLLTYQVPYERALDLERSLNYPVDSVEVLLPESGVIIETGAAGDWVANPSLAAVGAQAAHGNARFSHPPLDRGETLVVPLEGWPQVVSDANNRRILNRDERTELFVGLAGLLVVAAVVGLVGYRWRTQTPPENDRDTLLQQLAGLEEAYEAGEVRRTAYRRRKEQLMGEIADLWDNP